MRRFIIGLLLLSSSTVALAAEKIPTLGNVRIYNRALSEAEVKALYEFEKP